MQGRACSGAEAADFLFQLQLLLFELRNFNVARRGASLKRFDMFREGLVFLLQFLQMRTQAHGHTPLVE